MMWLERLLAVAAKEVRQLSRDRITIGLIIGIPTIQLLLFGYAINFDVRGVSTAVLVISHPRGCVDRSRRRAGRP